MNDIIKSRLKESAISIGPFFLIILLIHFSGVLMIGSASVGTNGAYTVASIFTEGFYSDYYLSYAFSPTLLCFLLAYPLMVIGMTFYGLGADTAIDKMGRAVGESLTKKKSVALLFIVSALLGALVTFAEPDLTVFSTQLMGESGKYVLIAIVSIGVGLLLGLAFVRILYQWNYRYIVYVIFLVVFGLGILVNKESFFPIVFDGSGVTIGSMTVPFVLAMGIAVAQLKGSKNAEDDSFGLTGLASLGPLIAIFVWAKIYEIMGVNPDYSGMVDGASNIGPSTYGDIGNWLLTALIDSTKDVGVSMLPLTAFFILYDIIFLHLSFKEMMKIFVGLIETFVGLTIFMVGINSGFMPVARQFGTAFASDGYQEHFYVVIILCILIGTLIILAEPSVHVLGKQVEEVSAGSVKIKDLYVALCIGVCMALVLGIARIQYEWDISLIVVPILMAFFVLSLFVPNMFTAIALDSSGVASATMASAFLLPMAIAMATAKSDMADFASADDYYEYLVRYGTGMVGLVFICSLFAIECIGLYGRVKQSVMYATNKKRFMEPDDKQVIRLPNREYDSMTF